jgi:hypothetical protein
MGIEGIIWQARRPGTPGTCVAPSIVATQSP